MVLVSHTGAAWLPAVLDGLAAQTAPPGAVVAVDTGSRDGSLDLLRERLGADRVTTAGRRTPYADAVAAGVALLHEQGVDPEWLWLLHDDANPAPDALAALHRAAAEHPEAALLGPKLREWPSLRRLLELGVTISGTGRRETGLERGEYDQGQHDELRRVLAVNTAGLLVRADVLRDLGGFDRALPVFGNDLDLGWRAARAGHHTLVVPDAVVFHAEAAHRGTRRTSLTGRHTHYQERRAAIWTLLANVPGRHLPWQALRLALGSLVRVLGFLAVRSVGEAADEAAALLNVYARPGQLRAARRARAATARVDHAAVAPLLPPWWLPYRHGLDFVTDLAEAATNQAQDVAERRREAALAESLSTTGARSARRPVPAERDDLGPAGEDDDLPEPDTGLLARFLTSPLALGLTVLVVAMLVGTRAAWGRVSGGALPPAPQRAADWWQLTIEHTHPLAQGTDVAAPAYVAVLALLGTVLGGSAAAAVSGVLLAAMPLALWGAWRLLRVVGRFLDPLGSPRWLLAAGAATYALVPAVSGAWGGGRLGTVAATALLPWLAHAMLGFGDPEPDRRWRAAWRSGLLLALVGAFAPAVLVLVVLVTVALLVVLVFVDRGLVADRSITLPPLVALLVPVVLLLPWWAPLVASGDAGGLLLDPGRVPPGTVGPWDLVLGRLEGGAPAWLGAPLLAAALAALVVPRTRPAALVGWAVVLAGAVTAAVVTAPVLPLRVGDVRPSAAALLPVLTGGLVVAATALAQWLARSTWGGWRRLKRPLGVPLVLLALAGPALGAAWFATTSTGRLGPDAEADIPAYMRQSSLLGPAHGVLVVRGSVEEGLRYEVRRGDGTTLGEDEVLALTPEDPAFSAAIAQLATRPSPTAVERLADAGIEYVVFPAPADGRVAAQLDATTGLSQASAEDRSTRAWHVDPPPSTPFRSGDRAWQRSTLVVVQVLALLLVLVLCGPTRRRREAR